VKGFYHGFANATLWPLFHGFPTRARFDRRTWEVYARVNHRFAATAADIMAAGAELVWVHDYQLMLTPAVLRERLPATRIAFFLHIPFSAVRPVSAAALGSRGAARVARVRPDRLSQSRLRAQLPRLRPNACSACESIATRS
jgi:hypothetical protein